MLSSLRQVLRAVLVPVVVAGATTLVAVATTSPASADTDPQPPVTVPTVSADALPTVQIDGIVHDQVIVGNRVYATGEFSKARPAGSAVGTDETTRSNILAYDLTTGALVTSWAPVLNAPGRALAASADGTRIIVGGSFTQVNGVNRFRLAELDATTGALLSPAPSFDARVSSLAVSGDTLYVGGIFNVAGGQPHSRLAAVSISTGAVLSWAPTADAEVLAVAAPAGSGKVVVGGKFTLLNGVAWYGMGALDATTGANLPWAATSVVRNAGANAAIYSLNTDGPQVYGSAYAFGAGGNLEGTFAASSADGALVYVSGCRGDTYDTAPVGGVLYHVGHPHDCSMIGGHPQTEPWTFQRATAQTTTADSGGRVNQGGGFNGRPAPELLHWLPSLDVGTFSGQDQAAWSVAANGDYVALGGEFPRVNNEPQQGLVRFAVRDVAPNQEGPQDGTALTPALAALEPGRVRVSWKSSWDRDNRTLTYEVMRGAPLANAQVIATLAKDTAWWSRPRMSFTDTSAPVGTSQTYRVRVRDALGNVVQGSPASVTVPAGDGTTSPYRDQVRQDAPQAFWPMGEASGTTAFDFAGEDDVTLGAAETRGAAGALIGDPSTATTFAGTEPVPGVGSNLQAGPATFTVEAWFRTTTRTGGKIVGFGNLATGQSSTSDRHVYLRDDGRIVFGAIAERARAVTSPTALNDGQWHHVVGAVGPARGMELFVDGRRAGRDAAATSAQVYNGFWRIGGDGLNNTWPGRPTSRSFAGDVDEVAVYPTALPLDRAQAHYVAAGRALNVPTRPADAYGAAVWDAEPSLYLRMDETAGPVVVNTMTNDPGATASGGVVLGEPGGTATTGGRSVRLPGGSAQTIVASASEANPTVYSTEAWFRTTSTGGGRIIGFGNAAAGTSSQYDRHVYMLDDGRIRYGISADRRTVDSPESYDDGQWHQVVATQGANGMHLYVDGALVASRNTVTPQNYTGFWRVGSDNTWGGADTNDFAGSIDEVAVYPRTLPADTISQHWQVGAPNRLPVAAFTSSCPALTCSFDGTASSGADGSIAAYAWQFGDGTIGSGASPSHTFAAGGTFDVRLTVTDDDGATDSVTHTVTATEPPAQLLATDGFGRTVASGFGTAELGGTWTFSGAGTSASVADGSGRVSLPAGRTATLRLGSVSSRDTDVTHLAWTEAMPTGGGAYLGTTVRGTASADYRGRVRIQSDGAMIAQLMKVVGGTETTLAAVNVTGLTYVPGTRLRIRVQAQGASPTTLRLKVWQDGTAEPTAWRLTTTDSTDGLQGPGSVGFAPFASGSATSATVVRYDDLSAVPL